MSETLIYTIISLSGLGIVSAIILYLVAQKFRVDEDPRIDKVEEALPNTNCGGCGYPGCRAFAEALVNSDDISELNCPVGGNDTMQTVAGILGKHIEEKDPYVAVVRCSGSFEHRKKTNVYDGAASCTIASSLYGGDTGCAYGCVGLGECVDACDFEAMYMDEKTGLPVVIEDKCTACNACVKACPKDIIQLWPKGKKDRRIYVACINEEKGGLAKKNCSVACIGCSKCADECKFDAITVDNYLAYIDYDKCKLCRKCVDVCPTETIQAVNFPARKPRPEKKSSPKIKTGTINSATTSEGEVDVIEMVRERKARPPKMKPKTSPEASESKPSESQDNQEKNDDTNK
ncbi:MAG: Fe-S cluster domain-containing protein [Candidatus Cyclobacteriaceae bacterium M3_2C_046]